MDDSIRISDADRDRIAGRLRDHFAEGRITREELDERLTATLNAKTFGDLRPITADLPGPGPGPAPAPRIPPGQWRGGPPVIFYRRGPRLLPLLAIALIAALVIPGAGLIFLAFAKVLVLFWLVALVAGVVVARRFGWRSRPGWPPGPRHWHHHDWPANRR